MSSDDYDYCYHDPQGQRGTSQASGWEQREDNNWGPDTRAVSYGRSHPNQPRPDYPPLDHQAEARPSTGTGWDVTSPVYYGTSFNSPVGPSNRYTFRFGDERSVVYNGPKDSQVGHDPQMATVPSFSQERGKGFREREQPRRSSPVYDPLHISQRYGMTNAPDTPQCLTQNTARHQDHRGELDRRQADQPRMDLRRERPPMSTHQEDSVPTFKDAFCYGSPSAARTERFPAPIDVTMTFRPRYLAHDDPSRFPRGPDTAPTGNELNLVFSPNQRHYYLRASEPLPISGLLDSGNQFGPLIALQTVLDLGFRRGDIKGRQYVIKGLGDVEFLTLGSIQLWYAHAHTDFGRDSTTLEFHVVERTVGQYPVILPKGPVKDPNLVPVVAATIQSKRPPTEEELNALEIRVALAQEAADRTERERAKRKEAERERRRQKSSGLVRSGRV